MVSLCRSRDDQQRTAAETVPSPPRVSVIVPVYNAEKYIAETLGAVMAQDFKDFDVHVVDDCSTDSSPEIIHRFCALDTRFFYHRAPRNFGGPAGPRNLGIAASSGNYVAFCDADDIWAPHKLTIQVAVADRTGADIVSAGLRDFADGDAPPPFLMPAGEIPVTKIGHGRLLIKNWIALSSTIARRSALEAVGPFNVAQSHVAVEDFDMWLRITQRGGRAVRVDVPLLHYRKLPTSISAKKNVMVRKALNVIGEDYSRRGRRLVYPLLRPFHWIAYVGSSTWMRVIKRAL